MPAKNSVKQYVENGYYHLYNRGVDKRTIFVDQEDYNVFVSYLRQYLTPKNEAELRDRLSAPSITSKERDKILKILRLNNFYKKLMLLAYCLMPNHFHFFVKQNISGAIDAFIQSLCTRYTMYFNKKYKRIGPLYQGVYKAVLVETEPQYLHLNPYIHKQALAFQGDTLESQPSSYKMYSGQTNTEWIYPDEILAYFSKTSPKLSYPAFVEKANDFSVIQNALIDECI